MKTLRITAAAVLAAMTAGCAGDGLAPKSEITGSIKPKSSARKSPGDTHRAFCAQRHVDYQTGKAPGGATTAEKKAADDRLCDALNRQG